ncbi:hypothetical protein FQN53_002468 [Emmonsiellopsis sp. PD_33]|nr:hypothetical protein FQN53_002468 [Emmonsiellopsis sp. PD_33]
MSNPAQSPIIPSMQSLSVEIILRIFQSCDNFRDIVSCSSTCKILRRVWDVHQRSIIWNVGKTQIPAFNDALMAVRATQIVKVALQNGELPPDPFPIGELSGEINRPYGHELEDVYGFQHLARCLQILCRSRCSGMQPGDTEAPGFWEHWQERVHSSIYRFYLAGAVLYRAYQEPPLQGTINGPRGFLDDCSFVDGDPSYYTAGRVTNPEAEFLLKYPAYNFNAYEEHGSIFKPLADLFANEAKKRVQRDDSPKPIWIDSGPESTWAKYSTTPGPPDPVDLILFHETVQFILIHETIQDSMYRHEALQDSMCMRVTTDTDQFPVLPNEHAEGIRRIQAIRFSSYVLEQVSMPSEIKNGKGIEVKSHSLHDLDTPMDEQTKSPFQRGGIQAVLYTLFERLGEPNHYDESSPCEPPELLFIEYLLRNYLGMQFIDHAFQWGPHNEAYYADRFIENTFLFGETDWDFLFLFERASYRRPKVFKQR